MAKPIHPILVHFPIALLVTSFAADAISSFAAIESLRNTGWWTLFAASALAVPTVVAGLLDMRRATLQEDAHVRVHRHMWVGITLLAATIGLAAWRWTYYSDPSRTLSMVYLDAAFLACALAAFQGWLGGELVYTHGVFVRARSPGSADSSDGKPQDKPQAHSH